MIPAVLPSSSSPSIKAKSCGSVRWLYPERSQSPWKVACSEAAPVAQMPARSCAATIRRRARLAAGQVIGQKQALLLTERPATIALDFRL